MMLARFFVAKAARTFVLVPTVVGLLGVICAVVVIWIGQDINEWVTPVFPSPSIETTRSVLSTIAGSSLTVLSLVYSLTLVVFTLAAGNIGPRLLSRFTEDGVIQTTAGVLAGTFLYCILILQRAETGVDHALSTGVAIIWAFISIGLVIVFIHNVATRVTIDEEIARIGRTLSTHIETLLDDAPDEDKEKAPEIDKYRPEGKRYNIPAERSGYVDAIVIEDLVEAAQQGEVFVEVIATPGQFVVQGCPLVSTVGETDEIIRMKMRRAFMIAHNRTPEADLDFSILLMVEIAQRALSPGLNDAFTAVAVIDHLSAAFSNILKRREPLPLYRDDAEEPRVWCSFVSVQRLLDTAFHPLRRDGLTTVTVALRLIEALERLAQVSRPQYREFLRDHVELISEDAAKSDFNDRDKKDLEEACQKVRDRLEA